MFFGAARLLSATAIWLDSFSVALVGGTFSLSTSSPLPQSILKRVTRGHVARMFRCNYNTIHDDELIGRASSSSQNAIDTEPLKPYKNLCKV